ncbi:hypothetical protein [Nannocystis bainbridge]|uniref:Uncharacterized protein n=1 Tax=Nannocystis bainbridge TaxID=2995303 RepID=A0ABT5EDF7_9BACT|nr:hypothetical protein [Nannocystis bainbridge]MDC0723478.1 hypothetical protein [Nannocystis bainbridge]
MPSGSKHGGKPCSGGGVFSRISAASDHTFTAPANVATNSPLGDTAISQPKIGSTRSRRPSQPIIPLRVVETTSFPPPSATSDTGESVTSARSICSVAGSTTYTNPAAYSSSEPYTSRRFSSAVNFALAVPSAGQGNASRGAPSERSKYVGPHPSLTNFGYAGAASSSRSGSVTN